jgi:ADP-heptose:LPS heptosyltransferase
LQVKMTVKWATICRYGGIGDNLVASSVLPGLRKRYGRVEVITQRPQHVIFQNNPYIDKLSAYNKDEIPGTHWQDWHWIRSKESDFFVNLSHSMETMLAFLPGQCQFQWPADIRRRLADKSYLEIVHDICGIPYSEIEPGFYPTDEELADVRKVKANEVGEKCVAWVLTGTRFDKNYPHSAYAIARIIQDLKTPVVLVGGPGRDMVYAEAIRSHVTDQNGTPEGLHVVISPSLEKEVWPIRRVCSFVQVADVVVGPDTGPMWAVAMSEVPKVALLSHASPTNITKHWKHTTTLHANPNRVDCWPCHQLHDKTDTCRLNKDKTGAACISDISVDVVVKSVADSLEAKTNVIHLAG